MDEHQIRRTFNKLGPVLSLVVLFSQSSLSGVTMNDIAAAVDRLSSFVYGGTTNRISELERALRSRTGTECRDILSRGDIGHELLRSAFLLKRTAAQIDVMIHALGILLLVPDLLHPNEKIEYLSLGAGNTGRAFDLETTARVAEFKFIRWQGGSETIRQNALFKDFLNLAEYETPKAKFLYVLGLEHPIKFLRGRRALRSVLSRNVRMWADFHERFGDRYKTVGEYYSDHEDRVRLEDVTARIDRICG